MNGADILIRTLLAGGVDVCFANPGTSEMHFCAALDKNKGMRGILCLFEGVVTGAADGYGRMSDKPAGTLLHLGPGLGNGLSNLHNAKKARTPIVNIVGEHATYHIEFDAPLTADIEGIAGPVSDWVRTSGDTRSIASDATEAIAAARSYPGAISTLILPADTAWGEADDVATVPPQTSPPTVSESAVEECAAVLRSGEPTVLMLGGRGLRAPALEIAGRIAAHSNATIRSELSAARTQRGAGRVAAERIPYVVDQAVKALDGVRHLILVGAKAPVAFFAYPNKPSQLFPQDCAVHVLATPENDIGDSLERLSDLIGARSTAPALESAKRPNLACGELTLEATWSAIGHLLPEGAIVSDESITSGRGLHQFTRGCPPHDWLYGTGGAIGRALPEATGAAVACPDRSVLCLSGDGGAMYTIQALWTQARENLNVTTVIFNNRSYAILHGELRNTGAIPGPTTHDIFDLDRPNLDWVAMAGSMGVEAVKVTTAEQFNQALATGFDSSGPMLIETMI
jgi:acetolactate synthase-1/2/3 large subunit